MISLSNLPDLQKGREVFEHAFGKKFGGHVYRSTLVVVLPLLILAALAGSIAGIVVSGKSLLSSWNEYTREWVLPVQAIEQCAPPDLVRAWKENKDPNEPADQRVGGAMIREVLSKGLVLARGYRSTFQFSSPSSNGWVTEKEVTPLSPGEWQGLSFAGNIDFSVAVRGGGQSLDKFVGLEMTIVKRCR